MAALAVDTKPGLLSRAAGLLLRPRAEWRTISREDSDARQIFYGHVLPLIALVPVGGLIGSAIFGPNVLGVPIHVSPVQAAVGTIIGLVLLAATFIALVMLADSLAVRLGSEATFTQSFKLVAYCSVPTWLILILVSLVPPLRFLLVAVLWSTWLAYLGARTALGMDRELATRYIAVLFVAASAFYAAAAFLTLMQFQILQQMGLLN
jgi:hypothetical protein